MNIMKQKRYTSLEIEIPSDQEPCCICQVRVREKKSKYFFYFRWCKLTWLIGTNFVYLARAFLRQEEYTDGDNLGILDCGHDFHTNCIKQWLMQKNLCPICKTTGLPTWEGRSSFLERGVQIHAYWILNQIVRWMISYFYLFLFLGLKPSFSKPPLPPLFLSLCFFLFMNCISLWSGAAKQPIKCHEITACVGKRVCLKHYDS